MQMFGLDAILLAQGCQTDTKTHIPYSLGSQCYLPPSTDDIPAFTPSKAATRSSDPRGMQGWVDLVGLLHTEIAYPPENGHPSKY